MAETLIEFASVEDLDAAAEKFVAALGTANAGMLLENLRFTKEGSDAFRALWRALVADPRRTRA